MPEKDSTKQQDKKLREKLFRRPTAAWDAMDEKERARAMEFAEGYKAFLDAGKTEREAIARAVALARADGFVPATRAA
jgi:ABC-type arginine transport system ATPase subunit